MIKSTKIKIKIKNKKEESIIKSLIKDLKLSESEFLIEKDSIIILNVNQYRFTDIRNEVFRKNFDYQEFEEVVKWIQII